MFPVSRLERTVQRNFEFRGMTGLELNLFSAALRSSDGSADLGPTAAQQLWPCMVFFAVYKNA
ncbi:hypothetical protein N7449_000212 [Penicillium cf. viridicatum]|uniref:Uncharacterized protein n=1 Tax=Penicillium cf. viridicatum TaxID=2972119 RepID=A0A9W9N4G1_9EURO|nr:hypothetical protein N7449_000212 [Penicillium cf. viridicatum]